MSALPVEIIEPDPAATSLSNDETVNKEGGDQSAPTKKNAEMIDAKSEDVKETNGSTEVKEAEGSEKVEEKNAGKTEEKTEAVVKDEKSEKQNGHKRGEFKKEYDNNRGPRNYNKGPNHSKYDPTVLESTDDHKQIRAQVCRMGFWLSSQKTDIFQRSNSTLAMPTFQLISTCGS